MSCFERDGERCPLLLKDDEDPESHEHNVTEPTATSLAFSPSAGYEAVLASAVKKSKLSWIKTFAFAVPAGVFIGFGDYLMLAVGLNVPTIAAADPGLKSILSGAFGLPFGLLMVVICGAELFTSNCALMIIGWCEGKVSLAQLFKSWLASYLGNLAGCYLLVGLVLAGDTLPGAGASATSASTKVALSWGTALARGVMANYLVCMAVYMATHARDFCGKFVAVFLPVSAFVAIGLEHSIANMFIIALALAARADGVTVGGFAYNESAVTIGNILGGAVGVGLVFFAMHGSLTATPSSSRYSRETAYSKDGKP